MAYRILAAVTVVASLGACAQQQWHWERPGATAGDFYQDRGQCNAQAFAVPGAGLLQIALVQNSCLQGKGWEKVRG
jgi:hypothetical protein